MDSFSMALKTPIPSPLAVRPVSFEAFKTCFLKDILLFYNRYPPMH